MPLASRSTKQLCVSHMTSEPELVSIDAALRLVGLPAMSLWTSLDWAAGIEFWEDEDASLTMV